MVARELIGKVLVRVRSEGLTSGIIVETEAYVGPEDKASHAYNWRRTSRNEAMYGPPGIAYVYIIYGRYHCLNVVTFKEGYPDAVLIRALYPIEGLELMARRRGVSLPRRISLSFLRKLTSGPGRLCQAMDITRELNFKSFLSDELFISEGFDLSSEVLSGPRIGVDYAQEYALKPWRFFVPWDKIRNLADMK